MTIRKRLAALVPTTRIPTVTRISLDLELIPQFGRLAPGVVLDVGSSHSPYKKFIPHTRYMRLDIDTSSNPDICCDLQQINWQSDYFDTVIATEVLEHLEQPQRAIDEIYRVLKPSGVCILSTRFIFPYHPHPKDYFRFTWDSLEHLFNRFCKVEIFHHGNRFQVLWQIINDGKMAGVVLNLFNPIFARIRVRTTDFPCGFVIYAQK